MFKRLLAFRQAGTKVERCNKLRWQLQSTTIAATLMLAVCFSSCKPKYQDDYDKKCLELELKKKQLDYLKELYSVKSDIEFNYKIKKLDSLINDASRLK